MIAFTSRRAQLAHERLMQDEHERQLWEAREAQRKREVSKQAKLYRLCGVYAIDAGNKFYLGASQNMPSRWNGHRAALRQGKHHCKPLQEAFNVGGMDALHFRVVAYTRPEDRFELESAYGRAAEESILNAAPFDPAKNAKRLRDNVARSLTEDELIGEMKRRGLVLPNG